MNGKINGSHMFTISLFLCQSNTILSIADLLKEEDFQEFHKYTAIHKNVILNMLTH